MNEDKKYIFNIVEANEKKHAVVPMFKQALGGNDALDFTSTLQEIIELKADSIIVDMQILELINSSGLGMLVSGLSTLKKYNIVMVFVNVPTKVISLLEMTHLNKVFKICKDIDTAVNSCI